MCKTWYLSLPVGTIFAFSVNEEATLAQQPTRKAMHNTVSLDIGSRQGENRKFYVGFVRDVSMRDSCVTRNNLFHCEM